MIQTIWIKSFRCLSELILDFSKYRFISIVSENNVGKTSILEASYVLGHLKSFNTNDIRQVVPFGDKASFLGIKIASNTQQKNYYLKIDELGKKYVSLNDEVVKRRSKIESLFRTQYISSDSIFLLTSTPSYRREQLDSMIAQLSLSYRKNISKYKRIISQKNKCLKNGVAASVIYQFNSQLAPLIVEILKERMYFISQLSDRLCPYFQNISVIDGDLSVLYQPTIELNMSELEIKAVLDQRLEKERQVKCSLIGPHRDDIEFLIDGKCCRDYFSRGVCRIVSYLFQLSIAVLTYDYLRIPMLLLLDEPFSEIHYSVKRKLIQHIPKSFYILYTSTQMDEISSLCKDTVFH